MERKRSIFCTWLIAGWRRSMGVHPNLDWPHKADHFMRAAGRNRMQQVSEVPGERQDSLCFLWGDYGRLPAKVALGGVFGWALILFALPIHPATTQPASTIAVHHAVLLRQWPMRASVQPARRNACRA